MLVQIPVWEGRGERVIRLECHPLTTRYPFSPQLTTLNPLPRPSLSFFHISSMADTWDWLCKVGVVKTRISIHWWAFEWPITKIQVPSVGKGKEKEIFPAGKEKRNVSRWKRKMNKGSPAQTVAKTRARWKRGCGHRQQRLDFHTRWQKRGKLKLH